MSGRVSSSVLVLLAGLSSRPNAQAQDFEEFAPPCGRCFVRMPTKPVDKPQTSEGKHGKSTTHLFVSRTGEETHLLGWTDYVPGYHPDKQAELEANRDNLLKGFGAKLISSRNITIN